jgi:hypothetical protein
VAPLLCNAHRFSAAYFEKKKAVSDNAPQIDGAAFPQAAEGDAPRTVDERLVRRRESDKVRKRRQRAGQTTDQRARTHARDRTRKREARKHQTTAQREAEKERNRRRSRIKPFMAVDGEGGGTDALGRQHFLMMAACDAEGGAPSVLHRDGNPLLVTDCLEFILSLPANRRLTSFSFGYDVTQILRGIRSNKWKRILEPRQGRYGPLPTYWGDYAITYQQGQYLRVARVDLSGEKRRVLKGSSRTIYDAFGFFQCSFVKAIKDWQIGSEEDRKLIEETKNQRAEFSSLTPEIIDYCQLECRLLSQLMTELQKVCLELGILPRQWSGAGWLASALFSKNNTPKRPLTLRERDDEAEIPPSKAARTPPLRRPERDGSFELAANLAYYGGRFEVSRVGHIPEPVYEYDLKSAYPAAMLDLPCPLHTCWEHRTQVRRLPRRTPYLAKIAFSHPGGNVWCGLPFRRKGGLFWPYCGVGWYWSPEIEAAQRSLGASITPLEAWVAVKRCDCHPYDWVKPLYEKRQTLNSTTRGYPIKLGLNSLYGKTAQRCGRAPYHDAVAAGLITAKTRARLIDAIGHDPGTVVMQATDALFSTRPLPLDVGVGLGQWEPKKWPDLFIAQPGVYWSPIEEKAREEGSNKSSIKSRGAPRSAIGPVVPQFEQAFREFFDELSEPAKRCLILSERLIPQVGVPLRTFLGMRLALVRHKPTLAGQWQDLTRFLSFEWSAKRDAMRIEIGDGHFATYPIRLPSSFTESEGHPPVDFDSLYTVSDVSGVMIEVDEDTVLEATPDYLPFLPHE